LEEDVGLPSSRRQNYRVSIWDGKVNISKRRLGRCCACFKEEYFTVDQWITSIVKVLCI